MVTLHVPLLEACAMASAHAESLLLLPDLVQSHHLLNACKAGDGAEVKRCLDGGVNVNCRDTEVSMPC
jgi:hypothetical protein